MSAGEPTLRRPQGERDDGTVGLVFPARPAGGPPGCGTATGKPHAGAYGRGGNRRLARGADAAFNQGMDDEGRLRLRGVHVRPVDELGAIEIGRLVALVEAMDVDLQTTGLSRRGDARTMVKMRLQASRRLQEWLDRYAMTSRGRAELLRSLSGTSLAADIARRRNVADDDVEAQS